MGYYGNDERSKRDPESVHAGVLQQAGEQGDPETVHAGVHAGVLQQAGEQREAEAVLQAVLRKKQGAYKGLSRKLLVTESRERKRRHY